MGKLAITGLVFGSLLVVLLILGAIYIYRVRHIAHRVGAFELAIRPNTSEEWTSGVGVYSANQLDWHRTVSLSFKPRRTYVRGGFSLGKPIWREGGKVVEIEVTDRYGSRFFAMHDSSYDGLVSWMESAPPKADLFA
ncbi:hypothetical protein BK816_03695 [Boudabousia tangfeifanii]|uniref:DUF2550 domain-containing protein n=1 Tax=Boudabousia tangfeifanii TaxID=1912795 RepID=A0A1D9MK10_9ACTO|nr:DUF2550 family protein [Boudabousia tangfeifanii]AOZ72510.1 hypothetical protein BK816_03695 [Boudabousia tangfeifanii]